MTDPRQPDIRSDQPQKPALNWGYWWWSRLVSNQRPSACEADALPLSYETEGPTETGRTTSKTSTRGLPTRTREDLTEGICSGLSSRDALACSGGHGRPITRSDLSRTAAWPQELRFVRLRLSGLSSSFAMGDDVVRGARM
jgi:hypothetical protein